MNQYLVKVVFVKRQPAAYIVLGRTPLDAAKLARKQWMADRKDNNLFPIPTGAIVIEDFKGHSKITNPSHFFFRFKSKPVGRVVLVTPGDLPLTV